MKMEQSFEVQAPLDVVWAALIDLERVAPCLPGASITGHDEDGTYHGTFQVKLGPTTASYRGTIKIEEIDEANHTATLRANGTDKRGQGGAHATIVNSVREGDGVTHVDAVTDFTITGRLARFGRGGMIQDISNRLLRDFATCLQGRLGDGAAAPSGAEVAAGDAAPEAVAAAAPEGAAAPSAEDAAASASPGAVAGTPAGATPGGPPGAVEGTPAGGAPAASGPPPSVPRPQPTQPAPAPAPIKGFSLFFSVLWERIKRLLGRLLGRGK
ncbi:MAG TPA: SRPBCC family protein [Solirubrobacteraceae bacterium]|jgi:carbon monoxide dehydrogenase subunit G